MLKMSNFDGKIIFKEYLKISEYPKFITTDISSAYIEFWPHGITFSR